MLRTMLFCFVQKCPKIKDSSFRGITEKNRLNTTYRSAVFSPIYYSGKMYAFNQQLFANHANFFLEKCLHGPI